MKEPNVVLRLIASVAVAAVLAIPAYYYFTTIVPVPAQTEKKPVSPPATAVISDEPIPEAIAREEKPSAVTYPEKMRILVYFCAKEDTSVKAVKNMSLEEARAALLNTPCADGYKAHEEDFAIEISRTSPAGGKLLESERVRQSVSNFSDGEFYSCVNVLPGQSEQAKEEVDLAQHISIPGLSDNPAAEGNLQSLEMKSPSRCKEGFTEHPGKLTDIIPEGYTDDADSVAPAPPGAWRSPESDTPGQTEGKE